MMKNITLSAPEPLIDAARRRAQEEHTTLNAEFRTWLEYYGQRRQLAERAMEIVERISNYASSGGRKFTREEMNER
jgi:hypothetical protein